MFFADEPMFVGIEIGDLYCHRFLQLCLMDFIFFFLQTCIIFLGDSTPDEHNSRGGEAEGSTCNNSSTVPQEKFVKHVVEGPDGNSAGNALFEATDKQVDCPGTTRYVLVCTLVI